MFWSNSKFFSNFFDLSRLSTNISGNQISSDTGVRPTLSSARYHLETETNLKTGVTTRYHTAGYQPYTVNYLISQNLDPKSFFYDKMKNLKVQLAYNLGGFTDKDNIKVLTDSVSPGSASGSKFIPDVPGPGGTQPSLSQALGLVRATSSSGLVATTRPHGADQ